MNADDYFKIQQNEKLIHKLDEWTDNAIVLLHLLDEKIQILKDISVSIDCKVIKPVKVEDLFKF